MPQRTHINRRHVLAALGSTAVVPGISRASSRPNSASLTDEQLEELETIIAGLFGDEEPLPLGLNDPDDEVSDDGLDIGAILSSVGDNENSESDEADSDETVVGCANTICRSSQLAVATDIGTIAAEVAEVHNDFTRQTFRAQHLLHILVEQGMVSTLSPDDIAAVRENVRSAARYTPLIGSFNNVVETACAVEENPQRNTVSDFYLAVAAFCVEVAFFQFGVGYRFAFRGTNVLATRTTFARLLQRTSPRIHAAVLSEIHWALREGASHGVNVFSNTAVEFALTTTEEFQKEGPQHGVEGTEQRLQVSDRDLTSLEFFDCGEEESIGSLLSLDWGSDDDSDDALVERAETIISECPD